MRRALRSLLAGAALSAALGAALCGPGGAAAVPDSGAGADTPGTTASVAPRALAPGQTLSFSLGGFPAGETVYLKIDDGQSCSAVSVHGACVVHQQRIAGNGTVRGSFVLPRDLAPGRHWLRFLASTEIRDSAGAYQGIKGYTKRSPDFTVRTAVGTESRTGPDAAPQPGTPSEAAPGTPAPAQSAPGTLDAPGAVPQVGTEGAPLVAPSLAPVSEPPASTPEPTEPAAETIAPANDAAAEPDPTTGFPSLGASVLALCLLAAAWTVLRARRVHARA